MKIYESVKIPARYKSSTIVENFIFGKYDTTSGRKGYVHPFNLNLLSRVTRANIEKLLNAGWTFDKIIISPVYQTLRVHPHADGCRKDEYKIAFSFIIAGTDCFGNPAIWNRKETRAPAAGQTYIQWMDHYVKAIPYLESAEFSAVKPQVEAVAKPAKYKKMSAAARAKLDALLKAKWSRSKPNLSAST